MNDDRSARGEAADDKKEPGDKREPGDRQDQAADASRGALQLGVAGNGDLRWAVADVGGPTEAIRAGRDLSPIAAVALGRALSAAALLLRFTTKEPGQLVLEVMGDGPLGKVMAEVDSLGRLRGLVGDPHLATPEDGSLAVGWAVGQGTLRVTQESSRGRYSSQVELVTGELGKDLVHFLEQSQQIRSAVLLGVLPRSTGIAAAGGLLVEAFPGVPEETLERLERNITALDGVSAYLERGGLAELRDAVLDGFDIEELERHPLDYHCRCERDSVVIPMQQLSAEELDSIADAAGRIYAECAFCGTQYAIERQELAIN
ncbi:MAG: Hsp33 family molecular chaperone HslO [Acidobacteriota bacterium]